MTLVKIYSNSFLFSIFEKIIRREEGAYTSDEIAEAIRIVNKDINLAHIAKLINMSVVDLKKIKATVRMAEEIAKTTNEVPKLCDL